LHGYWNWVSVRVRHARPPIIRRMQVFQWNLGGRVSGMRLLASLVSAVALLITATHVLAQSPLRIDITGVGTRQIPVALAPLDAAPGTQEFAATVMEVVRANLQRSGVISLVETGTPQPPLNERTPPETLFQEWRGRGAEALVIGSTVSGTTNRNEVRFILLDTLRSASLGGLAILTPTSTLEARRAGHRISDFIYEKLTGEPGFFATRLAFIRKDGEFFNLIVSDSDGQNTQVALRSRQPIISLAWSPDGTRLAYVSYEERDGINKPVVYVHTLATGRRVVAANERGSNSSPAWSPDGKSLAVVLTRDGNSQIYRVSAEGGAVTRLTRSAGIDTEPAFTPDGRHVYFTSDRGGSAQIYRVPAEGGAAERITFSGPFNARPQISPDGRHMVYVTRRDRGFQIAVMDLTTRQETLVSEGSKDDSPSFAPNSRWVIYSSRVGDRTLLTAVSLDGKLRSRLSAQGSDIRGPSWGRLP
jgi:TolB protein